MPSLDWDQYQMLDELHDFLGEIANGEASDAQAAYEEARRSGAPIH